ncbi:MAG TPA: succinate--CoA ligase subunit beta, partial [Propionibacteriaceae bacterium]|nr:succinate--CoA ligase subunit beta [Propionibacteriaceae bacterium]
MEIEVLADERPDALLKVPIDPRRGLDEATAADIVARAGFDEADAAELVRVFVLLGEVYRDNDATL